MLELWIPTILSTVSTIGVAWLSYRYKVVEAREAADALTRGHEIDDRKVLTAQIMEELQQVKKDRDEAHAQLLLLNQKLIEAERRNAELTLEIKQVKQELERLRTVMTKIDPTALSKGCKLFGTPECPFTKVKTQYEASFGEVGS